MRKENCAHINTINKNATNPKEDVKLLQSRLASSDPYWNLFSHEMGYLQLPFTGSKTQGRVKKRKLPFQHQYLSCVFLSSFPPLSLPIHSPRWKRVSISLNVSPLFLKEMRGSRRKKRGTKRQKETEDTWRRVTLPHHLFYKKAHASIYPEPYTGIVRVAFCLQS